MGLSNMTLVKIAAVGGFVTVSMGYALRIKLDNNVKSTEYCEDALNTLKKNRAVVELLGQPIRIGRIDVSDEKNNYTANNKARYEIPVRGPKQHGKMFFWAHKDADKWNVDRIELALNNDPTRRLLVKKENQQQD